MSIWSRLRNTIARSRHDAEIQEELRFHLDMIAASGESPGPGRLRFGHPTRATDETRAMGIVQWLDLLVQDVRYALRVMRKTPGFAATALLILAMGIGANTAIFTVVNGVLLTPLGYPNPGQLMSFTTQFPLLRFATYGMAPSEYLQFQEVNRSFADVGAYNAGEVNVTTADRPLRVRAVWVDEHLLRTLGVQAAQGRLYGDGETAASGATPPPIVLVSHDLWRTAFGGRPLVGRTIEVNGRMREVLGIMAPNADVLDNRAQIWLPLALRATDRQNNGSHYLNVIGRLKDGVSAEAAASELSELLGDWATRAGRVSVDADTHVPTTSPKIPVDHGILMNRVQDALLGTAGRSIWLLQAAVGVVLLIACANLAGLYVARAETRRREYALRAALGASRRRLLRQAMTEGVLLSLAGGTLGLWLAGIGVQALIQAYPTSLPRTGQLSIDLRVLCFTFAVSTLTGVLFGFLPAAHNRFSGVVTALQDGSNRGARRLRHGLRRVLVTSQVALAVILVIGAGLLLRTVYNLANVDAGFDRAQLVTFSMTLPQPQAAVRTQTYERLLQRLQSAPGVQAVTAMSGLPPERTSNGRGTTFENHTGPTGSAMEIVDYYQIVMGDYFKTMGIPILEGRGFEPPDFGADRRVAVVNETLARAIGRGRTPVGQRLRPGGLPPDVWFTIVGVAKDVKQGGVDQTTGSELYLIADQQGGALQTMNLVLRTRLPPASLRTTVEGILHEVDPSVPIVRFRAMDDVFADSIRRPRLLAQLLGGFAGLALLLAAVGTYGVLSYVVAERRRELSIRMALGASRAAVLRQVMTEGLVLTLLGVGAGLIGAVSVSRFMTTQLFGVAPTDPATLAAVVPTIALVAGIACALPAWRASRLDPAVVFRDTR